MVIFYGEELLAPRPTPKLEDHPLSAVRDCIFVATLHIWRPFLYPQPEDAPCLGDRDPLIMGQRDLEVNCLRMRVLVVWRRNFTMMRKSTLTMVMMWRGGGYNNNRPRSRVKFT
jgi:hypothetical protein